MAGFDSQNYLEHPCHEHPLVEGRARGYIFFSGCLKPIANERIYTCTRPLCNYNLHEEEIEAVFRTDSTALILSKVMNVATKQREKIAKLQRKEERNMPCRL
ncbi:hypothetical protein SUGI_0027350 [Cryptomeria japonica]|nr:hypothetical protein SUGI_0027350 [Cryptomeria japonica]